MKKILLINDSGNYGGVQSVFKNIVSNIKIDNCKIDILFATNGPIYEEVGRLGYDINYVQPLKNLTTKEELLLLFKFAFRINKEIKSKKYDVVYASGFLACMACGLLSYKYNNVKFIWHEHNVPKSRVRKSIVKAMGKNIRKIFVVSKAIKDNYPIDDDKVSVLYNGIETDNNIYLEDKDGDTLNFAIVSRIDKGKGHLEVIDAFNKCNNPKFRLYIIGGPTCKEAEAIEDIIKQKCNENKNIIYVGYSNEVSRYYKKMDVVIQGSTSWDSLPTVLIEAMNYNCALIGTRIGGIPEIIDDRNGYIIEIDNLIDNLTRVLKNLDKDTNISNIQKNSKIVLNEKFNLGKQVEVISDILSEL